MTHDRVLDSLRRRRAAATAGLAAILAALVVAGCAASSNSSASSQSSSGSALSAAAKSGLAEAEAQYAADLKPPTGLNFSQALKTKPTGGKTIVDIECTNGPSCAYIDSGEIAAAKAIGWNVKTLTFDDTQTAQFFAAMKTALQYNPVAVTFTALPYAIWKQVVPEYQKAGVLLVPISNAQDPVTSTILPVVDGILAAQQYGEMIAHWFIATSHGTGHALIANIPAYDALSQPFSNEVEAVVKAECPGCSVQVANFTQQQFGEQQIGSVVVSDVRRDPSINYILSGFGQFLAGIDTSLQTAGLVGKVQVGTGNYYSSNVTGIKLGAEQATTGSNDPIAGWEAVYEVLLHEQNLPIPAALNGMLTQLITKSNISAASNSNYYNEPFNYQADIMQLEKVQ